MTTRLAQLSWEKRHEGFVTLSGHKHFQGALHSLQLGQAARCISEQYSKTSRPVAAVNVANVVHLRQQVGSLIQLKKSRREY